MPRSADPNSNRSLLLPPTCCGLINPGPTSILRSVLSTIEIVLGLLAGVAALALLSRKLPSIPFPVLLALGGLVLGVIPGLPAVSLNPELVFFLFLPALLYPAALFTSWRDFRANLRPILLLAVGLV